MFETWRKRIRSTDLRFGESSNYQVYFKMIIML